MERASGKALFLASNVEGANKCYESGTLDHSVTESRKIQAQALSRNDGAKQFASRGCAAISLGRSILDDVSSDDDDDALRNMIVAFLKSDEMWRYVQARYDPQTAFRDEDISLFPTHVTRRTVPPDGMPLVHIDYLKTSSKEQNGSHYGFSDLLDEWKSRWRLLEGWKDDFAMNYYLLGVLTVWVCLSNDQGHFPLWVAQAVDHADPAQKQLLQTYRVKGKKHSVGVRHGADMAWYCQTDMKRGDAWLFDTQCCPHAAVDQSPGWNTSSGKNGERKDGLRESFEVRVLVLQKKTEHEFARMS